MRHRIKGFPVFVVVMSKDRRSWNREELMALDSTLTQCSLVPPRDYIPTLAIFLFVTSG